MYRSIPLATLLCLSTLGHAQTAGLPGQTDVLEDNIQYSGTTLNLKFYADLSDGSLDNLQHSTTMPGSGNLFSARRDGVIYSVAPDGSGGGTPTEWFNYNTAINAAVVNAADGYNLNQSGGVHSGLRGIAFHPDFQTNGKFYTSAMVVRPSSGVQAGLNYLGTSESGDEVDQLLAEWTYNHNTGGVDSGSYRELYRVQSPRFDHPIQQISFNPFSEPGDDDYGLLYVPHGNGGPLNAGYPGDSALGKIMRIDPLQDGSTPYTVPTDNPHNTDTGILNEVYSQGHRNPMGLTFEQTDDGGVHLVSTNIGRRNIEEVNIIVSGGHYGEDREGTFVDLGGGLGYLDGLDVLPDNEWEYGYTYPAAQYDHDAARGDQYIGSAIVGGITIDFEGDGAQQNQYIFADFAQWTGNLYQADLEDMVAAKTTLDPGESPDLLTWAPLELLMITLDADGDGMIDSTADNLNDLLNESRSDVRFARGANGEVFITSARTGHVYIATNAVASLGVPEPAPLIVLGLSAVALSGNRRLRHNP